MAPSASTSTYSWPPPATTGASAKPRFISSFTNSLPFFYFHHIIDADNALLTVEVIGPNLTFTFSHEKAKDFSTPGKISARLQLKTVGFLALVRGEDRHVLAIAESGHGHGRQGDLLDAPLDSPILPNRVWARRVSYIGELLGIRMGSPMDVGRAGGDEAVGIAEDGTPILARDERRGMFQGGHVEVKLAVYAVCTMLKEFGITTDFDNLTTAHFRKLKQAKWKDGTRPGFEVYFSRKNCSRCRLLVERLEKLTGMKIQYCWKQRLVQMVYGTRKQDGERRAAAPIRVSGIIHIDENDDEDDDDLGDEYSLSSDRPIDLTSPGAAATRSEIDLTSPTNAQHYGIPVDLTDPAVPGDQTATDEDAVQRPPRSRREVAAQVIEDQDINKPVPATPVYDDPCDNANPGEASVPQRRFVMAAGEMGQRHAESLPALPVARSSKVPRKRSLSLTEGLDTATQPILKRPLVPLATPLRKERAGGVMAAGMKERTADESIPKSTPVLERERRPYPSIEPQSSHNSFPTMSPAHEQHAYPSIEPDISDSSSEDSIPSTLPGQGKSPLGLFIRDSSARSHPRTRVSYASHVSYASDVHLSSSTIKQARQRETLASTVWGMPKDFACAEAAVSREVPNREFSPSPSPF